MNVNNTLEIGDTVQVEFTGTSRLIIQKCFKGFITAIPEKEDRFVMISRKYGVRFNCHNFFITRIVLTEKYKK